MVLGYLVLGSFVIDLWLLIFGLGSLAWDLRFGILVLGSLVLDLWLCIFGLGSLVMHVWLEIFGLGSLVWYLWFGDLWFRHPTTGLTGRRRRGRGTTRWIPARIAGGSGAAEDGAASDPVFPIFV